MSKFAILLNGEVTVTPRLREQLRDAQIIAADSGIRHAETLDLSPRLWVGDFDSSSSDLMQKWQHIARETHPKKKNQTDGALAIAAALHAGASNIILVGCLGGRSDQVFSHLMQILKMHNRAINCFGTSGNEEVWPLSRNGSPITNAAIPVGSRLSIAGISDLVNLTISGVEWPLENHFVKRASTLTLSNVVTANLSVSCDKGSGLIFAGFTPEQTS